MQEDYIPLHYDKNEALLDLQWAHTLDWCNSYERAWRLLRRVVRFIVQEGEDPGPKEPVEQGDRVETHVIYLPVRRYKSNVFKQTTQAGQEASHGCGF